MDIGTVSIAEYFLGRKPLDWADFLQRLHVKLLLVAEDYVAVRLVCHHFFLELRYVVHRQRGHGFVHFLVDVVVNAAVACAKICVNQVFIRACFASSRALSDCGIVSIMLLKVRMQSIILSFCDMM